MKSLFVAVVLLALSLPVGTVGAEPGKTNGWIYTLVGESDFQDCLPCGRPSFPRPARGSFELVASDIGPFSSVYEIRNFSAVATSAGDEYRLSGGGTYTISGQLAVVQEMRLDLRVEHSGGTTNQLVFRSEAGSPEKRFPIIDVYLTDGEEPRFAFYGFRLVAAPLREIWFSSVGGMTSANGEKFPDPITAGDLISNKGRVVKSGANLSAQLAIQPSATALQLDAAEIVAGGEVYFSLADDVVSERMGQIGHGDLLSNTGRIVKKNGELIAAFQPVGATSDSGLDALHVQPDGEIYFSISGKVESQKTGTTLGSGDVLSDRGFIIRTGPQLVAGLEPAETGDYGLDALYVWASGEIWFSTERGFLSNRYGPIAAGDLLSDAGYVVFRNLELVALFMPVEDVSDFGLDGLFIVSDAASEAPAPRFTSITNRPQGFDIRWSGSGRVFQVEKADAVAGPYQPASPIVPETSWIDAAANGAGFYRLRQW